MKKRPCLLTLLLSLVLPLITFKAVKTDLVFAQEAGTDSQEFFEEGNEEMNREIEDLEEQENQRQTLEEKEEQLEQNLQIHPFGARIQVVPDPNESLGLDDNLPFQPEEEELEIR